MRSRLKQLTKGIVEYEAPVLYVEPAEIRDVILPGKVYSFELKIGAKNREPLHLFFHSLNPRVRVVREQVSGGIVLVGLEISTVGLEPGDSLSGCMEVVYNGGVRTIPYDFAIAMVWNGKTYRFDDIDDFSDFVQKSPEEAAELFERRDFINMDMFRDFGIRTLYLTCRTNTSGSSGLKNFMTALGKPCPEFRKPEKRPASGAGAVRVKRFAAPAGHDDHAALYRLYLIYERTYRGGMTAPEGMDFEKGFSEIAEKHPGDTLPALVLAYYYLTTENEKRAIETLVLVQDQVKRERNEKRGNYVIFMYLTGRIRDDEEYRKAACEFAHRLYYENAGSAFDAYLEYRLNVSETSSPAVCYLFLRDLARRGIRGTVFLQELCLLFRRETEFVDRLNDFEIRAMLFGLRHSMLDQLELFDLLSCEITDRGLVGLYLLVLKLGYRSFGNPELLQAVCTIYINKKAAGPKYFPWYERAVNEGVVLKGLNELYLQSAPADLNRPLPVSVVRYFGYGRNPERQGMDLLFMNVLSFYSKDEEIRKLYEDRIREYALRKMKSEEYSVQLVPVFRSVLNEQNLNAETAAAMLQMLYLRQIETQVPEPRRLIIRYPQLRHEAVYPMKGNTVLVPVFSDSVVYAVEDRSGERICDPGLTSEILFHDEKLRTRCLYYIKESLYSRLPELDSVLENGITNDDEAALAFSVAGDPDLDEHYRAFLYAEIAGYASRSGKTGEDLSTFLLDADLSENSREGRAHIMEALIDSGFVDSAFRRGRSFGFEALDTDMRLLLVRAVLDRNEDVQDPDLLYQCWLLYKEGAADRRILEYLGANLDAGPEELLPVLKTLREKHVPTGDMVIRTMTEMIYTNRLQDIDRCFEWFMSEARWDDELFRAYLVLCSHRCLLGQHELTDTESEALRTHASELAPVSDLALLDWYAKTDREITDEDREIVSVLLKRSAEAGAVLSCFSELRKRFGLPQELQGRAFLEFRGEQVRSVSVIGTILPSRRFFQRTLQHVYGPIFAKSVILYPGERMQYYYSVCYTDDRSEEIEGPEIIGGDEEFSRNSRLSEIAGLTECLENRKTQAGREMIEGLLLKDAMISEIFRNE